MTAAIYVSGDRRQVMANVLSATVISKGGMVRMSSNTVFHLSSLSDVGTKLQNQQAARDVFLGCAMRSSPNGSTQAIPIAVAGVFEFNSAAATYEVGDLVGAAGTGVAGADAVSDDTVEAVTNTSAAIGRVFKRGTSLTRVQVEIFSVLMARPVDDTFQSDTLGELTATNGIVFDTSANAGNRFKDGVLWQACAAVPGALNATGTLTAALLLGSIVTTTSAAAVTATLDTGTAMDTAITSIVGTNTGFFWSVINTGPNTLTVTAAAGHTVIGTMTVATATQRRFFTQRTNTNTWITYSVT